MRIACEKGVNKQSGLEGYEFTKRQEDYNSCDLSFISSLGSGNNDYDEFQDDRLVNWYREGANSTQISQFDIICEIFRQIWAAKGLEGGRDDVFVY